MHEHLFHEERVAFGLGVHERGELGRRCLPADRADERGDRLGIETVQRDPLDQSLAPQIGERLCERMRAREIGFAVGAEHQQVVLAVAASEERDELQRRAVRPVQVVEDEEHGRACGDRVEPRTDGLEQQEPLRLGIGPQLRRRTRSTRAPRSGTSRASWEAPARVSSASSVVDDAAA